MAVYNENRYNSDEEIDKKQHARLLDEVFHLDKRPFLKKPSRTEPTTHVSEFNLIKSASNKHAIKIKDLIKPIGVKSKHVGISNKVKTAQKAKTLYKPLEKPQAERIRRSVGFKKTKSELNKWNSIIDKNRVASQLVFPLNQGEIDIIDSKTQKPDPVKRFKSKLDLELEKLEPEVETIHVEDKFPLTMQEMIERRQEASKLRAHQSYREAKAHRRNKIKSKSYHKIQRKEKLRQQIKQFELLQKTDPEEALRKLEQLEKTRAEERMTLRHRSTGQWAKSKQVRAKYDKESRQALAQQLAISRDLTQKLKNDDTSDSETEVEIPKIQNDPSNPWISNKTTPEVKDFYTGYRKYWEEKNQQNMSNNQEETTQDNVKETKISNGNELKNNSPIQKKTKTTKPKKKSTKQVTYCNSSWIVTENEPTNKTKKQKPQNTNIDEIFDDLEDSIHNKTQKKLKALQNAAVPAKKRKLIEKIVATNKKSDLVFARERQLRPELDDELKNTEVSLEDEIEDLKKTINNNLSHEKQLNSNIDPDKYIKTTKKVNNTVVDLETALPDVSHGDDNNSSDEEDDEAQKQFITEAFADDDIVADFSKEKEDLIDSEKPKDIDLSLPGWGEWGGKTVKPSKRKKKRFIIKMPKDLPRRDQNKKHLIINEHKNKEIKKHQVSELPFPFTSVKEFEASIRAPVGDTFVPQTAFRRLIKPPIITKKGAIIEPMSNEILLKQKFTKNGMLVNN